MACLAITTLLASCRNDQEQRYLYLRPSQTVYNTATGHEIGAEAITVDSMLIHVSTPYARFIASANPGFSLVGKAYAMHKNLDRNITIEKVTSLRVITLRNYNALYPAGSDITKACYFFKPNGNPDSTKPAPIPVTARKSDTLNAAAIIGDMNIGTSGSYYSSEYQSPRDGFIIVLGTPPATQSEQQFAIVFETATPSRFGDTTKVFTLKP